MATTTTPPTAPASATTSTGDDLADAHLKALDHLAEGGATTAVNLGTGVGSSVLDVIHAVEAVAGTPVPFDIVTRRAGDPVATFAAPERSRELLGWKAQHGLGAIVQTAYDWHRRTLHDDTTAPD